MHRLATVTTLLSLALTAHAGGIYKCQIDGRTVYQQVACPVGKSARVEIKDTPASSLGGGLRAAEVRVLQQVLRDKAQRLPGNEAGILGEDDAMLIASIYRQLEARRGGSDQREAAIAEASLRENLGRHGLELEQVEPELPGETILDRVQDELALRRLDPQAQTEYRAQRRQLLEAQGQALGIADDQAPIAIDTGGSAIGRGQ